MKTLIQSIEQHIVQKRNEHINNDPSYTDFPNVIELGDGEFSGEMKAYLFKYNGKVYYSNIGIRCPFYAPHTIKIENGIQIH